MRAYIIRRLLLIIPTLFLVTLIVFAMMRLIPGSVVDLMVADLARAPAINYELTAAHLKHLLGLDLPIHVQYAHWVSGIFQGDLGTSLWTGRSVGADLLKRIPVSAELALISETVGIMWALPLGTYSAIRQDTAGDYIGRTIGILAISLPAFWVATMVIVYPSIYLHWSPQFEYIPITQNIGQNLVQFLLPAIIEGLLTNGTTMRMQRTMMLEVLRQDYIRTAWAKGLGERTVIVRHALKNALIPVLTTFGVVLPLMLSGQVVIETIFCLPGMGLFFYTALQQRDYPIISAFNLIVGSSVLIANLIIDLLYAWLDPRVTYK